MRFWADTLHWGLASLGLLRVTWGWSPNFLLMWEGCRSHCSLCYMNTSCTCQLKEVWISRTWAPVWVRAVSQLSCAASLWLLRYLCLLFSCTSSACCPSRSYKCHSRWLGEAVSVITAARFAEAWLCTKKAFFSPPGDSKLSVLQMQIWSFQENTVEEMCDLRAGSKAACLSSWHNSYHALLFAVFSLLLLGQLLCSW